MDILIKFYNSWGEFWEAFPLFTLLAIYVVFVCIHKIQNIRRSKGVGNDRKLYKSQ